MRCRECWVVLAQNSNKCCKQESTSLQPFCEKNQALQSVQVSLQLRKEIIFPSLVMTLLQLLKNNKPVEQLFVQWKSKQGQVQGK